MLVYCKKKQMIEIWKETVMVNNSNFLFIITNINKTNNYLSLQVIEHKNWPPHMTLQIQVMVWDRHKIVAGLKLVIALLGR